MEGLNINNPKSFFMKDMEFRCDNSYVMGILNVTPDSFSDGGKYFNRDSAVRHALEMLDTGAHIIDIGGESTRPGSEPVSADEEIKRVVPVIEEILDRRPDTIISVDTTKTKVAAEVLAKGAAIINDVSALTFEPEMASVLRDFNAWVVLMHIKGLPKNMQDSPYYSDVVEEVYEFLESRISFSKNNLINNIIIDPGIGFGKRVSDNFELIKNLQKFKALGYPILVGLSRKSFLGKSLNLETSERDCASTIAEAAAVNNGACIIRTHNVKYAVKTSKILRYISNPMETEKYV